VGVMRRPPAWLTWLVVGALAAVYAGERIVPGITIARVILSGGGAVIVMLATVWRFLSWRAAPADTGTTERLFFLAYAGCALALVGFFLAGDATTWLGIDFREPQSASRFHTAAAVLACIVLAASVAPALAAQWAAPAGGADAGTGSVDRLRIAQVASAGLAIGLAGAFLFLAVYVASARDKTVDLSYFRTASPGSAAQNIVESLPGTLRVLLFFPPASEVKDQVLGYFRALDAAAENIVIEEHDRLASPALAEEHNVIQDGTVILAIDDRSERLTLPTRLADARTRLRKLDGDVQQMLMRVAREERTIYLTVGHGEINDPSSTGPLEEAPFRSIDALRNLFRLLNYRVQDLGIQGGLGNDVPADAAVVLVLGPQRPFLDPELQAIDRYLGRGGSVLLAMEPEGMFQLGPLRERLGIEYRNTLLADDQQHLRQRGNISDRRLIVTDRFTSHTAVTTLGQAGAGAGILMMGAGHLETFGSGSNATFVVRSLPSTFADLDRDFEFDQGTEERKIYSLVAAVESDSVDDAQGMRAIVVADAELFSDAVVSSLGLNAALAADAMRWLGREEDLAGETTTEEDVAIAHTRNEDVAWFYSTILGAPSLVLVLGLVGVRRRRRHNDVASAA
jgi:hypothetical protein